MLIFAAATSAFAIVEEHVCSGKTFNQVMTTTPNTDIAYTDNVADVYLVGDIELSGGNLLVDTGKTLNLCLNGHVLKGSSTDNDNAVITVKGTLNIYDCGNTVHHFSDSLTYKNDNLALWVWDSTEQAADHTVTGGAITGGFMTKYGWFDAGGLTVTSTGSVTMYGGNIVGNYGEDNGSAVINSGTFIMSGGTIQGNYNGRGFNCVDNKKSMTISGGTISKNTGAGVYASGSDAITNITGTTTKISENNVGINVVGAKVTIANASIVNNLSAGVQTSESATELTLQSATVSGNESWGLQVDHGTVKIIDSAITNNGINKGTTSEFGRCGVSYGGYAGESSMTLGGTTTISGNNTTVYKDKYSSDQACGNLHIATPNLIALENPSASMNVGVTFNGRYAPYEGNPKAITNDYGTMSYTSCFVSDSGDVLVYDVETEGKHAAWAGVSTFNDGFGWTSNSFTAAAEKYTVGTSYALLGTQKFEFMGWSSAIDDPSGIDTVLRPNKEYHAVWKNAATGKIVRTQKLELSQGESASSTAQGWSFAASESSAVLTLENCTLVDVDMMGAWTAALSCSSSDYSITIVLSGINQIGVQRTLDELYTRENNVITGAQFSSDLTMKGSGSLTIYDSEKGIKVDGGNLTIASDFSGTLTIYDAGTTYTPPPVCAFDVSGNVTIAGGTVRLYNGLTNAVKAGGSFAFTGGSLIAAGGAAAVQIGEEGEFTVCNDAIITANEAWDGQGTPVVPTVTEGVVTGFEAAKYIKIALPTPEPEPGPTPGPEPEPEPEPGPTPEPEPTPTPSPSGDDVVPSMGDTAEGVWTFAAAGMALSVAAGLFALLRRKVR